VPLKLLSACALDIKSRSQVRPEKLEATQRRAATCASPQDLLDRIAQDGGEGRTPIIDEISSAMGLARESSLTNLLAPLQRKELISIEGGVRGRSRTIALTPRGKMVAGASGSGLHSGWAIARGD
jgi:hypothetical protein